MHNKNEEKSTTKDDEGQAGQEDLKSVPWDEISTSNNEDTSIKIVISNMKLNDEGAQSGKHEMWLLKDLKKGLLWVVDIGVRMRLYEGKYGKRKDEGSKCLDQGDGRDERWATIFIITFELAFLTLPSWIYPYTLFSITRKVFSLL